MTNKTRKQLYDLRSQLDDIREELESVRGEFESIVDEEQFAEALTMAIGAINAVIILILLKV